MNVIVIEVQIIKYDEIPVVKLFPNNLKAKVTVNN